MDVQTGQQGGVLASLLRRDLAQRRLGDGIEPILACGVLEHTAERLGRITYVFEESASVVLLLRGGGWYHERDAVTHRLAPGDVFIRPPGRVHRTIPDADGQWLEFFLHMPKSAWDAAVFTGVMRDVGLVWHPGLDDDVLLLLADIRERMRDPQRWSHLAVIAGMLQVVAELRARHDRQGSGDRTEALAQAELILRGTLDRTVSVRAVASQLGLEWETFRKQFRQRTGQSPAAYRKQARLAYARILLVERGMSVTEVARQVGYADGFALSKAYRTWAGVAPSQMRRG